MLYSHLHVHAASQRYNNKNRRTQKDAGIKDAGTIKMQEDFFNNVFTSRFIARVRKGCSRCACERVLEIEHKLHILTSTTYDCHVVSFLFSWCSTGGLGLTLLDAGFLYGILSASSLYPKLIRGFSEGPLGRVWISLPHLVSSCLEFYWQLLWDPNLTELNNNSTPTRSPTGSLKSNV